MKEMLRKMMMGILAASFLCGLGLVLRQVIFYDVADTTYEQAQSLAFHEVIEEPTVPMAESPAPTEPIQIPLDEGAQYLTEVDIQSLRYVNQDVLGWIYIPETPVSYPLMMADTRDEYLHTTWDGQYNYAGSIFLEHKNARDLSDFNTIIYGHRMKNDTMFGSLSYYEEQSYRDAHPYIYIAAEDGIRRYEVFAAYVAGVGTETYRLYFPDDAQKAATLSHMLENNILQTGLTPDAQDQILTLSTCVGTGDEDYRWVVHGVLTEHWEKE